MQAKLGAGFLIVALLYVLIGLFVPLLKLDPAASVFLSICLYVVIGLGASWILSSILSRRLRELARAASEISQGDLTRRVETSGQDETAELARCFSLMNENLLKVVLEVQSTGERIASSAQALSLASGQINTATEGIARTAHQIARGADDQASQVLRTTDTTRGLSQIVDRVASRARDVHESAAAAADRAAHGAEDARRAAEAIGQLTQRTAAATAAVEGFCLKATQIGNLVNFITSISHQTHLLAINAAIEAARAGEEGRGFGVVAEEVSHLADTVRHFAEQISSISEEIMRGSREVADEIRRSVGAAEELREVVTRGASSFEGILTAIRGTAARVGEISQLTGQQKTAAEEVAHSLEEISRIAKRNAVGTEQASSATYEQTVSMQKMADSAHELARTSDKLRSLIAVFRLH